MPKLEVRSRGTQAKLDDALRSLGVEPTPARCDELRPPQDGEVILTVFDAYALASYDGEVAVADLEQLGDLEALGEAELITVVEAGERAATPVHAMAWRDGRLLIDLAPVAYSLDLKPRSPRERDGVTLIVAGRARADEPRRGGVGT